MVGVFKNKGWKEIIIIIIGTALMAFAINNFYSPNHMVTGGVTGLGIIAENISSKYIGFAIPLWFTNAVLNIPLFLLGVHVNGKAFLGKTLFATVSLTAALYYTQWISIGDIGENNLIISALFGGVFSGCGLGLVFRCFATTGGTDLAASIVHKYLKHISLSKILFMLDSCVIVLGLFVFGPVKAMYAIIAVFTTSKMIDTILEGLSFSKAAFIISDKAEDISKQVMDILQRGATSLSGTGMYTGKQKNVLLCVVSQKEVIRLKEIVSEIDRNAFLIMADVREVLGEGFKKF